MTPVGIIVLSAGVGNDVVGEFCSTESHTMQVPDPNDF